MTASAKDLIERARSATIDWDGFTPLGDNEEPMSLLRVGDVRQLADALERLTQPGGEFEPVAWLWQRNHAAGGYTRQVVELEGQARDLAADSENLPNPDVVEPLYSAATVTRLIAERDAAIAALDAKIDICGDARIHALQEQVKMLRALLEEASSYTGCAKWSPSLTDEIAKALAATEPKDTP